jgi:hypothetical protein
MTPAEGANQRNAVLAGFLGWALDAFDFFILTLVIDDIAKLPVVLRRGGASQSRDMRYATSTRTLITTITMPLALTNDSCVQPMTLPRVLLLRDLAVPHRGYDPGHHIGRGRMQEQAGFWCYSPATVPL